MEKYRSLIVDQPTRLNAAQLRDVRKSVRCIDGLRCPVTPDLIRCGLPTTASGNLHRSADYYDEQPQWAVCDHQKS
jgi:hypothetical protein